MRYPTKKECYHLICEMEMMDHIVSHSLLVCQVAMFLADHLNLQDIFLHRDAIQASALLHDITKTRSFKTKDNHAQTGEQLLHELDYPEIGDIIGQHVILNAYADTDPPKEAEIVNYADKRVLHDRVVSLKDRMAYVLKKYGKQSISHERILRLWEESEYLEKKIFATLPFSPDDLNRLIDPDTLEKELLLYRSLCAQLK
jgi:uncharacterized protein